jgi:AmmeMemoRadiSam system protein B
MTQQTVRPAAVAGSWYPGHASALAREVDRYLDEAVVPLDGDVVAIIAPHAGLMYSGAVAAHAYRALRGRSFDVAILVGPSHYVGFDGVAVADEDAFESPLGLVLVEKQVTGALCAASDLVCRRSAVHAREHSLEMQLPFLARVQPGTSIVPAVMGYQTRDTVIQFAEALATTLAGRRALLVASTDLSHYLDVALARQHDERVVELVGAFDPDSLLVEFERYPEHDRGRFVACGGGPAIAVMRAARALGATGARVLRYANSGDVSGDYGAVVGYLAAAIGRFDARAAGEEWPRA